MVLGIAAGRYAHLPIGLWMMLSLGSVAIALVGLFRQEFYVLTMIAIATAVFFTSSAWSSLAFYNVRYNHVVLFSSNGSVLAELRGRVVSNPRLWRSRTVYYQPAKTRFLLQAEAIRRIDGTWIDTTGLVSVRVDEPVFDLSSADRVELVGTLRRYRSPGNPGQYDWSLAQRYKGILVKFRVPGADGVKVISHRRSGILSGLVNRARGIVRQHLVSIVGEEESPLLEALVLGERSPTLQGLNRTMVEAGVAHFLSISGLHLGIFLGFVYMLCRIVMFRPSRAGTVVLVVLVGYVLLARSRPPLLRAAVMAGAIAIGLISARSVSTINLLAAAAIVLLIIDPLSLFEVGFQMSFAIVFGIILLHTPIKRLLFGRWLKRRGLMVFGSQRQVRRWIYRRGASWAIDLVIVAIAAYLAALPLVAYYFGIFSPYAPILSVLLLPMVAAVLIPAYLSSAMAFLTPNLAAIIGSMSAAPAKALEGTISLLKRLPGLSIDLYALPAWWVLLAYLTMGLWVMASRYYYRFDRRGVVWRRLLGVSISSSVVLVAATVINQIPCRPDGAGEIHVLDVSHGNMLLLQCPDGRTYLFDAGTLAPVDPYRQVLRPFLRAEHLPNPAAVFISHANVDHYNGVIGMLQRHRPRKIYINEFFGKRDTDSPMVKRLMQQIENLHVKVVRLRMGDRLTLADGVLVEVLWPGGSCEGLSVNNSSLVLRVHVGKHAVVIPGDIAEPAEAYLSNLPAGRIHADVLILPHHGSFTKTLGDFIEAVDPQIVIQSSSFRPDKPELLGAISHCRRYATYRTGWINLRFTPQGLSVKTKRVH